MDFISNKNMTCLGMRVITKKSLEKKYIITYIDLNGNWNDVKW